MSADRLLIIDDERAFATFVGGVAAGVGYEVRSIQQISDVEFSLNHWRPSVLFLDIFMPERDGLELLGALERAKFDGQLVLMSGADELYLNMAAASAKARGLRLGGVLRKPCRKRELEDLLRSLSAAA
jgi:DNA-binding NtrC family response regulator